MPKHLGESRPQFEHPPDHGCEVAPMCLECPLPQCKYDDPRGDLRQLRQQKDAQLLGEMKQRSLSIDEAAKLFGVTTRTIFRISRRHHKSTPKEPPWRLGDGSWCNEPEPAEK